ncbi:CMGC/CDK protein kinase, partial [Phytophthora palmivora]
EELTFDYKWKALGSRQIKCYCGAPSCKGVIGTQNDTVQNEAQIGYFRDPEKQDTGHVLVGRRVRVFLSDEKVEYDVQLIKAYDEEQDRYEVEDLLEPAGYETDENDAEDEQDPAEKQYVQLKENGWQLYCPPGDKEGERMFAIPKKRVLPTSSGMSSAAGSRDPSPKRETMSQSPVRTPSPVAMARLESSFNTQKKNEYGELLDRDGRVVSNKLLVKFLPKEYGERGVRSLFVSRKHPNALVDADVFQFLDVPSAITGQNSESVGTISALSVFPKKSAAGTNDTSGGDIRLHTDDIIKVESIRKRAFVGVISSEVGLDLAGQPVYLQSWPYLEQEIFFTEEKGINEACLRELSTAITLSSLSPNRFMKLLGIIFPGDTKDRHANGVESSDTDELDLIAATIDDDGNPLPEGIDRLTHQKHYLAFEQPLHMFSGIFEARVSLTPELRKKAIFDMLQSLSAVHDQGYVHRFVAHSHLLVFKNGIKLGGFHAMRKITNIKPKDGEGSSIAGYEMTDNERKEQCYGAWLQVTAPEVLLGETKYTWRADVWSAGCVMLAILLEKVPFLQGQDVKVQMDLIYRLCGTPSMSWDGAHKLPLYNTFRPKHEYKMRLRKTLLEQRSKFPDFPEDAIEVLEAMLQLDPARRCTVKKLLDMRYFDSVRTSERIFDFSGLPSTFPVQKKKLVQHLLKAKIKKQRPARSSHHHSSHRHNSSEHHRHKRSASSAHDVSSSDADKSNHHDRHKSRSDKRKSRSLSTSRHDVKRTASAGAADDVEMQDTSEYVPLPASFTASSGSSSSRPVDDGLPPREKRMKLGWGMGLNSAS